MNYTEQIEQAISKSLKAHLPAYESVIGSDDIGFKPPLIRIVIGLERQSKNQWKVRWKARLKFVTQELTGVLELEHPDQQTLL